jgi:putative nucleotidyltransferase with HDIG domain
MSPHSLEVGTLIRAADSLAPLAPSASRLAKLIQESDHDLELIRSTVRFDLALTGRLLGAANAASPGGSDPITSIEEATKQLGQDATLELLQGLLPPPNTDPIAPQREESLWKHSILCALSTESFEQFGRTIVMPETFATALLHDLGRLVLERQPQSEQIAPLAHAQLGARIARHWGIPARICAGIEHHHAPLAAEDGPTRRLCSQVLLSDAVANEIGEGCGSDEPVHFSASLAGSLGLSSRGFEAICERTSSRYQRVMDSYAA